MESVSGWGIVESTRRGVWSRVPHLFVNGYSKLSPYYLTYVGRLSSIPSLAPSRSEALSATIQLPHFGLGTNNYRIHPQ